MSNDEPLELSDFVAETIKQIIDGVATAQEYATSKKADVNPRTNRFRDPAPQTISFDVAVTAVKGTKTQGGVAVFTAVFGLGSKGQSEKTNETLNHIRFSVPVSLPIGGYQNVSTPQSTRV
jgi:hypothetical protein